VNLDAIAYARADPGEMNTVDVFDGLAQHAGGSFSLSSVSSRGGIQFRPRLWLTMVASRKQQQQQQIERMKIQLVAFL
jgi:hypothetical protein